VNAPTSTPQRSGWSLLRRNPAFRRLWLARVVSFLGDAVGLVALIVHVAGDVGTGTAVALLLIAGDFTPALLSPVLGVIADRFEQRRTIIVCELGQAAAVGAIVLLTPSLPVLLVLVAFRSLLASTFQAASRSAVTELVAAEDLEAANALLGVGTHGLEAVGPALVAVLLLVLTPLGVLVVDAASFVISALLLAGLPRLAVTSTALRLGGVVLDIKDGLGHIWRHPVLRPMVLAFVVAVAFNGVDDVALIFLGASVFEAGESSSSLLYSGTGVGLLIGFAILARQRGRGLPAVVQLLVGLGVSSFGNLLTGLAPALSAALAMQIVRGAGLSLVDVGSATLVQQSVPRDVRGRVFANLYGALGLAAGLSYAVGGPILDVIGARATFVVAGAGGVAAAALAVLILVRQSPGIRPSPDP
jgi:MFS family permease